MANYTQKAILNVFEEMLHQMPFDKITVSALVAKCEISSNTFYYHYRDIYDLLETWLLTKKNQLAKETDSAEKWPARVKRLLHKMQDNPKLVYHIWHSISRERLERFVFNSVETFFYEDVKKQCNSTDIPDETIRDISGFLCYSFLGFILKFLWERMEPDVDISVDRLSSIFSDVIDDVTQKLIHTQR